MAGCSSIVQMKKQSTSTSLSRLLAFLHLFTINAIPELLHCVCCSVMQWNDGTTSAPLLELGITGCCRQIWVRFSGALKIVCGTWLSTLWVSSWEKFSSAEEVEVGVMDTFCKRYCPSKAWVKPAVPANDCWFTGVWIWSTPASLTCSPLLSRHSRHKCCSHVI